MARLLEFTLHETRCDANRDLLYEARPFASKAITKNTTKFHATKGHSLRLDVGRTDHLAPLLGFIGEQLAEVGRRARKHSTPDISK